MLGHASQPSALCRPAQLRVDAHDDPIRRERAHHARPESFEEAAEPGLLVDEPGALSDGQMALAGLDISFEHIHLVER